MGEGHHGHERHGLVPRLSASLSCCVSDRKEVKQATVLQPRMFCWENMLLHVDVLRAVHDDVVGCLSFSFFPPPKVTKFIFPKF